MNFRLLGSFTVVCIVLLGTASGRAAEEWADPNLKVTSGLELWLDATRLESAAQSFHQPGIHNRDPVETWFDASGHRRHARQVHPAFRPIYRDDIVAQSSGMGQAALLFDGLDDRLQVSGVGKDLHDVTIFIIGSPQTMAGNFSAFLSFGSNGKNDYETGINIDVGHEVRRRFDRLNVEGRGFGGEANLMSADLGLGTFLVLTISSTKGNEGTRLFVDGKPSGQRARTSDSLRMDEIRVGSRYYIYNSPAAIEQGFFHGAIAEILVYSRLLSDQERSQVEEYLKNKYAALRSQKGSDSQIPIRLLQPGFTVRELPVHLTNINALGYSPDGRLFALGYDGRIHVLRDTDGDGLEDQAEVFWDKPTLRTPLAMAWRPEGMYVVSNGKISLFREGPDQKVTEEVVVSGWVHDDGKTGGGVDALGLAFDKENNLYFGLGCADYTNAYRVMEGKSHYDLRSERGTILMVSPDRKHREIVCTGIRFPVGLAFNKLGDLFCTDQEGETWLPGGNPLDKLNHIMKGKHYGFPPLNPDATPKLDFVNKIGSIQDELPVVGFGPQHQSTCGLVFNVAAGNHPAFGPALWEDDALVAGFSRGKIWRVRLVKTPAGYVGQPVLIAACQMLTLNLAISPAGDLLVACHSGLPDWGTGPSGPARLFKISYVHRSAPQPVAAWPAGPMEVRVAFDRPVDENQIDNSHAQITFGEYVRTADRFEVLKPPYKAVQEQGQYPRSSLRVASTHWSADRRTLSLSTDPPSYRATYGLTLPLSPSEPRQDKVLGELDRAMDLAYSLNGVEARWKSNQGQDTWNAWLPHLDLDVSRGLTKGCAEQEKLFSLLSHPGELTLTTRIVLPSPIRKQGYLQGPQSIVLGVRSADRFNVANEAEIQKLTSNDPKELLLLISSDRRPIVTITMATGKDHHHDVFCQRDQNQPPFPLPLDWQMLPWAPLQPSLPTPGADATRLATAPELAGGDWKRGETIFFSQDANCSACHTLRGKGGKIGPDLSNLVFRDAASVLRDVVDPSVVINPDYVSFNVQLKNGRLLAGIPRAEKDGAVRILDTDAKETVIRQTDIESLNPSPVSVMPKGYAEKLGQEKLRDLLTFLTNPPPDDSPAPVQDGKPLAPPLRRRAEVEAVLAESSNAKPEKSADAGKLRTLNVVLVAGPKDHGPGEHDYPEWQRRYSELLGRAPAVRVSTAWEWPQQGHWDLADVIVFFFWNHDWNEERYKQLDSYLKRGGGVVVLHSASIADQEPEKLAHRIGLAFQPGRSKYRHGPLELKFNPKSAHVIRNSGAITAGLSKVSFLDESYWPMIGDVSRVHVLATTEEEGKSWPMLWTFQLPNAERGTQNPESSPTPHSTASAGRVFGCILGHYSWTFDDPIFRILFFRGLAWAADSSVDRFTPLITEGVKWQEK
jgi:putative heme-binding domain-containing protein